MFEYPTFYMTRHLLKIWRYNPQRKLLEKNVQMLKDSCHIQHQVIEKRLAEAKKRGQTHDDYVTARMQNKLAEARKIISKAEAKLGQLTLTGF